MTLAMAQQCVTLHLIFCLLLLPILNWGYVIVAPPSLRTSESEFFTVNLHKPSSLSYRQSPHNIYIPIFFHFRTNNPALLQLLVTLSGSHTQLAVRKLVVKTITSCPDLLVPFLSSCQLIFDPRPSLKSISNIELLQEVCVCVCVCL